MTRNQAILNYRNALARQAAMASNDRWTMGEEIKALKAAAYVEIEFAKLSLR